MAKNVSDDDFFAALNTLPEIRWAQRSFGQSWWELIPNWTSEETQRRGFVLATQPRSLVNIPKAEWPKAISLLRRPAGHLKGDDRKLEGNYLSEMPFGPELGYIDIDIADEHAADAQSRARAYAITISGEFERAGLGIPDWFVSGAKGGLHGEVKGPPGVWTREGPLAILAFLREACQKRGIPYFGGHGAKPGDVYVDAGVFNRSVGGRGASCRLPGSKKPGGKPKTRISLDVGKPSFAVEGAFLNLVDAYRAANQQALKDNLGIVRKRNPLPLPSDKILYNVAKTVAGFGAASGSRHILRLGVSCWLLKSDVPVGIVVSTLESCLPSHDSPIDCKSVVETTAHRIDSGRAAMGLKKLISLGVLTKDQVSCLRNALDEDIFAGVGETDRPKEVKNAWRQEDLNVIREALSFLNAKSGNKSKVARVKNPGSDQLFAASHCASFTLAKVCDDCQSPFQLSVMRCWRNICLSCANLRSNGWASWVRDVWKKAIDQDCYYVKVEVPGGKLDYKSAVDFRDKLLRGLNKREARRAWVAPGYVLIVISAAASMRFAGRLPQEAVLTKISSVYAIASLVGQCKLDVLNHLGSFVVKKDAIGLSTDSWLQARKLVSSNKAGNQLFPWFDDALLRSFLAAKKDTKGLEEFVTAIVTACRVGGSAEKKLAAKKHREAHAEDCPCPKCGPFSTFHHEAVHTQTKTLIIKTITGDPAPTFMAVAKKWNSTQRAVVTLPQPTVSYALTAPAKSRF